MLNSTPLLKLIVVFCLHLFCYTGFSQDGDLPNEPRGSATNLYGKPLVVNCFISEAKKPWSIDEKKEALLKEREGFTWIKAQAKTWGISELSFEEYNIGLDNDIVVDKIEGGKDAITLNKNWVPLVLSKTGFPVVKKIYDSLKQVSNADHVVVLIFAKKKGRSFAQNTNSNNPYAPRFLEGAVIYNKSMSSNELFAGTIVHEFLHLFGAWDMYREGDLRSTKEHIEIQKIMSQSIMVQSHEKLAELAIEPVTAWRIGWSRRHLEWYEYFRPKPLTPKI